ncbi:hypothetical protein [Thiohalomonas denitrificans]|uniref:hypothetical protein n=1 Tax=Thiohalomonas denitrificans TaxID=415747 RepID=UPI0026E942AF|nr:hypothetical protein [Thiohalomonas denitrificans]
MIILLRRVPPLLVSLVLLALAAFAGAIILFLSADFSTLLAVHLALAAGAMPLITAAMLHFVPVLTRGPAPGGRLRALPVLMLVAGLLVFGSFALPASGLVLRDTAATLGILGAGILAWWIARRARKSLGAPHPGTYWYLAALLCLLMGLAAVLLMHVWPTQYLALRRFHLHLNALGFIGITALGTLQVLLPTAISRPDNRVGQRLREDLKWVFTGALLVATGAAWQPLLVWPGLLLWLAPLLRLAAAWWVLYRNDPNSWNGTATSLAGTLLGFFIVLTHGAGHANGYLPPSHASGAYVTAFLFPLVTGAASYLLPLWIRPGMPTAWHTQTRQRLSRFSALRVALFIGAGLITGLWGIGWGAYPAAMGLGLFAVQLRALVTRY